MSHYDNKEKRALAVYVSIFLLLVLSIAVGGRVSYRNFEEEFRHQAEMQVSAIAELKSNQLADWRRERFVDAQSFYRNSVFSGLVERYFNNSQDSDARMQIYSRLEYQQSYAGYERICLLDETGVLRFSIPVGPAVVNECQVKDAAAVLKSREISFLDIKRDDSVNGELYISIFVPVFSAQNSHDPLGVLVFRVDPETYLFPFINHWPIPSDTAETLLVRRDGEDVLYLNQLRFEPDAALKLRIPLTESQLPAVKAVLGQTGLVEGLDYRGKLVLADVRPVPDSPWFMVSKVDVDEVYAPLRERLWQTLLIVGLAILVAGAGLALVWRQQRVLSYRAKAEVTEALRASEEKFRKAFILSPDSININRLSDGMYVSINNGFTKIMGYTPDQVIGKTSLELNIWVDPQDRKMLVDGLKKKGEVENLEARFCASNGDIKYGLMSASILELNGIPHIISITRDITGRKQAEDELRESEENLSITLHSIGDGVISTDKDGLIVGMNPVAEKYCGWALTDARGKPLTRVFNIINAETRERIADPVAKVMVSGQIIGLANHTVLISQNGTEYQIADSAAPIKDKNGGVTGVVLVFSDVTEKYNATEKIRESEANFSDIFQTVSDGIAYAALNGEVLSINNSLEKILEIPRDRIVGQNLLGLSNTLLSGAIINKVLPVVMRLVQGRDIQPFEVEYKDKVLEVTATINRTSGRLTGVVRDITERKRAEERLEQFFSVNLDLLCVTDLDGNFIKVNKAWEVILGYSVSEIEHRKFLEFVHPEDMDSTLAAMATLENQEQVLNFVNRYRCMDGSYRFIEWRSQPSGNLIYSAARDITERKQTEESLRESEEKMHSIFRVAPTGIGVVRDRVLSEVNPLICEMTGYSKEELTGQSARVLYQTQEEFEWVGCEKYKQIAEKGSGVVETKWQKKDGSIVDILLASTPIDLADISRGVTFTALDITERKRAEEALEKRIIALTLPLENAGSITFTDLFNLEDIQRIQDDFSMATGVASIITQVDGTPITVPSNFCRLCNDVIRKTDKGYANCLRSDAALGQPNPQGPMIQLCMSGGLWDAGAGISVGGKHIANWLIGQVRDETQTEEKMLQYAREIGANEQVFLQAFYEVPAMSREKFDQIARVLYTLANQLSTMAYQNVQQARFITERKRAEEALRITLVKYKTLFDHFPLGISVTDTLGNILETNPTAEKLLSIPFNEHLQREIDGPERKIVRLDGTPMPVDEFASVRALKGKQVVENVEMGILKPDDSITWLSVTAAPLPVEGHGVVITYGDITARRKAEEALRASEERFRTHYDNSTIGLYRTTPDGRILMLNPAGVQMLGFDSFDEISRRNLEDAEFGMKNSRREFREKLEHEGAVIGLESQWRRKDGATIFVRESAKAFQDNNGKTLYYDGSFEDITGRVQAEFALRESEERYRTLVSNAPVVTFVTDREGIFTLSEGMGLAKLGLHPGQVVGLSIFDVYHDYPSIKDAMQNALAGHSQRHEVEVQGIVFDVFYTPVFDQQGKVLKVIGVSTDVTERKQAEDQIRQFNMKLEQRVLDRTLQLETTNKELEAFSYSVSHDLRAPLRGIDGWSQALLEDYHDQLDAQGQQYIERVRSETQRMGHLIDDMLRLSRLVRAEMIKEQVDLSAIARDVVERLKQDEPHRQVDFSIQAGLTAQGDPHLLESVLANLLGNAFKFTGKRVDARIEFGQTELKEQHVFFVRDNGAGFNMMYAQKLFGAFQRMHKDSEFSGTGIGLATVQRIIHRHGGRVWAEAEIERGATFYFTLG